MYRFKHEVNFTRCLFFLSVPPAAWSCLSHGRKKNIIVRVVALRHLLPNCHQIKVRVLKKKIFRDGIAIANTTRKQSQTEIATNWITCNYLLWPFISNIFYDFRHCIHIVFFSSWSGAARCNFWRQTAWSMWLAKSFMLKNISPQRQLATWRRCKLRCSVSA